jgi:hypothetical protein
MSPPRPAVLVLLLVLLVVIVLFVVGLGLGSQQRRGTSGAELSSLKERVPLFGSAPRVLWPPGSRCSGALPAGPCTLDVPHGKSLLRKVSVTTNRPMSIEFVPASTPDRTVSLDMTKDFSEPAELYVDYKGGRLTLVCMAPLGSACSVTVR